MNASLWAMPCHTFTYATEPALYSKIQPVYMGKSLRMLVVKAKQDVVYWVPRILSIMFILFLTLFSLDVFSPGLSAWEIAIGLFMHNIPALALALVLIISWKREIVGGIAFILAGVLYIGALLVSAIRNSFEWYILSYSLIIAGPAFLIGILFLIGWHRKKQVRAKNEP